MFYRWDKSMGVKGYHMHFMRVKVAEVPLLFKLCKELRSSWFQ